jgi:hypothetical protein
MKEHLHVSLVVALIVGFGQAYAMIVLWGYIAAHSPLLEWLSGLGLRGAPLRAVLYPIDFITNVLLTLPAAFVLQKLRPHRLVLFLVVAVVPAFILFNIHLVGSGVLTEHWPSFTFGWVQQLFALPAAAYLLHLISRPSAPDKMPHSDAMNASA